MAKLLSKQELRMHLDDFRSILSHFDYSSLKNIRFFNLESFYSYMETIKDNPFKHQYKALQKELDYLQPYLPFVSSERAASFLNAMSGSHSTDETQRIKEEYTQKLRTDFMHLARTTTTDTGWASIFETCEEIRLHKEEMCLASY